MVTELNPIKIRLSMIISMWLVSASIEGPSVSKQTTLIYAFGIMIFLNSKTT